MDPYGYHIQCACNHSAELVILCRESSYTRFSEYQHLFLSGIAVNAKTGSGVRFNRHLHRSQIETNAGEYRTCQSQIQLGGMGARAEDLF
jgi:hypothetical protein